MTTKTKPLLDQEKFVSIQADEQTFTLSFREELIVTVFNGDSSPVGLNHRPVNDFPPVSEEISLDALIALEQREVVIVYRDYRHKTYTRRDVLWNVRSSRLYGDTVELLHGRGEIPRKYVLHIAPISEEPTQSEPTSAALPVREDLFETPSP